MKSQVVSYPWDRPWKFPLLIFISSCIVFIIEIARRVASNIHNTTQMKNPMFVGFFSLFCENFSISQTKRIFWFAYGVYCCSCLWAYAFFLELCARLKAFRTGTLIIIRIIMNKNSIWFNFYRIGYALTQKQSHDVKWKKKNNSFLVNFGIILFFWKFCGGGVFNCTWK